MQSSPEQKLKGRNIAILYGEASGTLKVVYEPRKVFDPLILIAIEISIFVLSHNGLLTGLLVFASILLAAVFGLEKKRFVSVFDPSGRKIIIDYQSVWFPRLNYGSENIEVAGIKQVGVRRYIKRDGDGFELFLFGNNIEFSISGTDLSFHDAQLCAETIREVIGIKTPIKAEG